MAAKAHTLSDNFSDNTTDTTKWSVNNDAREVNQRVEARPPANTSEGYAGYSSKASYDLTGSSVKLEVLQTLTVRGGKTYLRADNNDNSVRLLAVDGKLTCLEVLGSTTTTLAVVPYDPVNHRWWQLREFGGTTFWEVSSNGQCWTTLFSKNNVVVDLTLVTFVFRALTNTPAPSPGMAIFGAFNAPSVRLPRRVEERRLSARAVRDRATALATSRHHPEHANNNDEVNYPNQPFVGNYSKGLQHNSLGEPDPISYGSLLRALESRDPGDFEEILQPANALKLTNPQAGLAFDLEGPDAQAVTQIPAPRFDSDRAAHEMGELYWMALARDVPFIQYDADAGNPASIVAQAIASLNNEFPKFGGKVPVTSQNLFRGIYPGEQVGPYLSQFLLKGNIDPRKPAGQGRDANDGFITYGARVIDQRQWTVKGGAAADYLTNFTQDWLPVQNGRDDRGKDQLDMAQRRFIRNLRDGANFVHFDQTVDAFYNAALYLLSEPLGDQKLGSSAGTGRPQLDREFPCNVGNPYDPPGTAMDARRQVGFGTFGPVHLLQALIEVAGRAIRAVWWQKWGVHRRLRPEEYGGRVDNQLNSRCNYPLHTSVLTSLNTGGLAPYFPERYGSYLLPQAYPEGCPLHPAYGAGHATVAGACATILKAFFNEGELIQNPVVADVNGTTLMLYSGSGATQMTVGGELNKLAGNIALFRNAAGVHWRSDYTESLPLGEAVAIGLLQEMSLTFNEDDAFFQFTRFNGVPIRIYDGVVETILNP